MLPFLRAFNLKADMLSHCLLFVCRFLLSLLILLDQFALASVGTVGVAVAALEAVLLGLLQTSQELRPAHLVVLEAVRWTLVVVQLGRELLCNETT